MRPSELSRRELLASTLMLPALGSIGQRGSSRLPTLPDIRKAPYRVVGPGKQMFCCFNWADTPVTLTKRLYRAIRVTDFWTGESLGRMDNRLTLDNMPPHSARLLECTNV